MNIHSTTLSSGLRVVTDSMPHAETITIGVFVEVGTRHEELAVHGISHMLEHMTFKGTTTRSAYKIAEEMDNIGGHLNAYTSRDHTAYYATVLKKDISTAIAIISDIVINPLIDGTEFCREQNVVLQEIYQSEDTPDDIVFDHLMSAAYPDQSIGLPILGTVQSVKKMVPEDLKAYMQKYYTCSNIIVSAAGNIEHANFVHKIKDSFASLAIGSTIGCDQPRYVGGDKRTPKPIEQLHLTLGFKGVSYQSSNYYALTTFSTLFGEGLSSRLFQEVREKRGLAYSVFSSHSGYIDSGLFSIYVGSTKQETKELIRVLVGEIIRISEGVKNDEVQRAKAQIKAGLLMGLESTSNRCIQIARQTAIHKQPISVEEIIQKIDSLDIETVSKATQVLFQNRPTLAVVGQIDEVLSYEELRTQFN